MSNTYTKNSDPFHEGSPKEPGDLNFERDSWMLMIERIYADTRLLLEREGQLIRGEMTEKVVQLRTATTTLVISGVVLFIGAQCLAATAIIMLSMVIPLWASAIVVTGSFVLGGGIILLVGINKINAVDLKLNKSLEGFKHIGSSIKEKVHEIIKH